MNEDFLHYVWKYKLFVTSDLKTTSDEELQILKAGLHNKNAGPDFLNAQLKIANQTWVGNVEIHIKSSDWYLHKHEIDPNYDAVVLHVVWENDMSVFMKNNTPIPTLVLKDVVNTAVLNNYRNLLLTPTSWIPCQNLISKIDDFTLSNWKERLFFERLERKSEEINTLLQKENNNFEAVLFQLLAKNFGLKINGDAFLRLAQSVDFSVIQKVCFNEDQFSALLFGQAGFLEEDIEDNYYQNLKKEYTFLKHKYKLETISKNNFSFFRMRPTNFPTIRIAQLVSLFSKHQNLFSKIINIENLEGFYKLFSIEMNNFWKIHYNFEKESKSSPKKLTKSFIDLLIINSIIPLKFVYLKSRGALEINKLIAILQLIKPEKNNIITKFSDIGITSKSSFDTQSLLELKNNYCTPKHCLQCAIGVKVLGK